MNGRGAAESVRATEEAGRALARAVRAMTPMMGMAEDGNTKRERPAECTIPNASTEGSFEVISNGKLVVGGSRSAICLPAPTAEHQPRALNLKLRLIQAMSHASALDTPFNRVVFVAFVASLVINLSRYSQIINATLFPYIKAP